VFPIWLHITFVVVLFSGCLLRGFWITKETKTNNNNYYKNKKGINNVPQMIADMKAMKNGSCVMCAMDLT
jgi:hypothetical protein